jgi:hypothetical protein
MNDVIMEERYEYNPNVQTKTKTKLQKFNKKLWKKKWKTYMFKEFFGKLIIIIFWC